ncbi:hypothetical protein MM01_00018 [Escherichia phage vB_EcoS_MM01]|uniref:Uncharacterized protein n=1 Tax=Escherichia phage vB_EcoS_MM01 TaxID=2508188 RepID=A0A482N558_9CAUD|nr:hypothetical protein MM01_00018 [Escherichia phage vB_EcoS_MM01]
MLFEKEVEVANLGYNSGNSLIDQVNEELSNLVDSGYKFTYNFRNELDISYWEIGNQKTGLVELSGLAVRHLGLSKNGFNELSEIKIFSFEYGVDYSTDDDIARITDEIFDKKGYVPLSSKLFSATIVDESNKTKRSVLEGGKYVTYYSPSYKRIFMLIAGKPKTKELETKKSGWALVKYEEVEAPE